MQRDDKHTGLQMLYILTMCKLNLMTISLVLVIKRKVDIKILHIIFFRFQDFLNSLHRNMTLVTCSLIAVSTPRVNWQWM
jgi:hypothetical protein